MKLSLQIKLIFFVVLITTLILLISLFYFVSKEREIFQTSFRERAKALALAFDTTIGSREELKNFSKLQSSIYKFIWLYPDLMKISISAPSPGGLKVIASNKVEEIGKNPPPGSFISYEKGEFLIQTSILAGKKKILNVFSPIHAGGIRIGAYEFVFSLDAEERAIFHRQLEIAALILFNTIALIGFQLILLRKIVISPLTKIRKGLKEFGKGNLNWRINLKRGDEIGELASGFDEMAEKLEESYRGMEKKVAEATKELREKLAELEKFQKLAVGRELKMIELKKEIERLKKQIKEISKTPT